MTAQGASIYTMLLATPHKGSLLVEAIYPSGEPLISSPIFIQVRSRALARARPAPLCPAPLCLFYGSLYAVPVVLVVVLRMGESDGSSLHSVLGWVSSPPFPCSLVLRSPRILFFF